MGMTVGWAKNWAGMRVRYSFGVERKAWSPCPGLRWQREGALQGGIWQQRGWSLAIWVEFRAIRGWGQSCFLLILPFSPDPSSPSPIIFSPLSLVSSPKPSWGVTQHLAVFIKHTLLALWRALCCHPWTLTYRHKKQTFSIYLGGAVLKPHV